MKCYTCHHTIHRPPSLLTGEKNFCNHTCYSKYKAKKWASKNNPRWNGGEDKLKCKKCTKPFSRKKYGERKSLYCSRECAYKDGANVNSGEKNGNWKGGKRRYLIKQVRPKPDNCEVCKTPGSNFKKGLHYDHNHKTGKFRGWLCNGCNTTLGLVKEDIKILKALIDYINENSL